MNKMKLYLHSDFENFNKNRARTRNVLLSKERFLRKSCNDSVAQLVEHYTFNVGVLGSNPSGITTLPTVRLFSPQIIDLRAFLFS